MALQMFRLLHAEQSATSIVSDVHKAWCMHAVTKPLRGWLRTCCHCVAGDDIDEMHANPYRWMKSPSQCPSGAVRYATLV